MGYGNTGWKSFVAAVLVAVGMAACGDATAPDTVEYVMGVDGGDDQSAAPADTLADPLEVRVTDAAGEPIEGLPIVWRVAEGAGAKILSRVTRTDSTGVAATRVQLGSELGTYRFAAFTDPLSGRGIAFRATGINAPIVESIQPANAVAGDTVQILGRYFGEGTASTLVLFGGFRGDVISASSTHLSVQVPSCMPTRTVPVTVRRAGVIGPPASLAITSDGRTPLDFAEGDIVHLMAGALDCIELPQSTSPARYLLVLQNAASVPDRDMHYQLAGLVAEPEAAVTAANPARTVTESSSGIPQLRFESELRRRERRISPSALIRPAADRLDTQALGAQCPIQVGDTCQFSVFNRDDSFTTVTARVEYVSDHAIFYQDVDAPEDGYTSADFQSFGNLFDNVIYDTDVGAFGMPSDVDGNGRIIILFTPVVNALTDRGSAGFIAGFFFGLDLTMGANSNEAEIFYSLVPDPDGEFSDERQVDVLRNTIPPVLAHEFQHMIAFNQRVRLREGTQNTLWLAEGLAHMAEDLVGDSLLARGDEMRAFLFKASNLARAYRYLENPSATSLIENDPPGTLELRGAGWLFVEYLMGQYGGTSLLRDLVQTTAEGVTAVEAAAETDWSRLFSHWSVALWADRMAEAGLAVDPMYTFAGMDLYGEMRLYLEGQTFYNGDPLQPDRFDRADLLRSGELPSSGPNYLILDTGVSPYSLNFAGRHGGIFPADAAAQVTILRF